MTVWGLFVWFVSGILGAIALDYTHLVAARTNLQVVADQAAHAAIYLRYARGDDADVGQIKTDAANLALASLPSSQYGTALSTSDINFGTFDLATRTFAVDENEVDAVRVRAYFNRDNGNAAISFLFRLIGRDDFNVAAQSVFIAEGKSCLSEGFVAKGVVDVTSNNNFGEGFCIHSNDHVAVQQNNQYAYGNNIDPTIVSMPDPNDLGLPGGVVVDDDGNVISGNFENNTNLDKILESDTMSLDLLFRQMENMITRYRNPDLDPIANYADYPYPKDAGSTPGWPDWIAPTDRDPITVSAGNQKISVTDILAAGSTVEITIEDPETGIEVTQEVPQNPLFRVYDVTCGANGKLTIEADPANDIPLEDIMIITDCNITFTQGSEIRNARIITTSTDIKSIEAPSDLTVGSEATGGNCGSGAQFVTLGGVDFASSVNFDSSQIIAKRDISFTANGNGQTGVSLISGGNITATANGDMNVCKSGMLSGMIIKQFRMVM